MDPRPHRLPDEVLARLAAGGGGAAAARHLVSAERSKHRLLVLGVARLASGDGHPHAKAVDHAYDVLADIEKERPAVVRDVLGYPAVGGWAGHTLRALRSGNADPMAPPRLGAIAAVAALKAGVACWTEAPAEGGKIMLPSLGQIVLHDRTADPAELVDLRVHADGTVEAGERRIRVPAGEQPGWQPLHRVRTRDGSFAPLVDDLDPYRWPGDTVIEERLPEAGLRSWQACLESAWQMLREQHWTIAAEADAIVSVLTPIKGPSQGMNSASAGGRFGAIAMSTPPDGRWLASTFAHEVQHAKLGAVLDIVELLEPDESLHYAAWRDDPRPLSGLIQGAYAYLGVSGFWRRRRAFETDLRPHIEFARWRECAFDAVGTLLDSGCLTPPGKRFVTAMRRTLAAWLAEPVPAEAQDVAGQEEAAHRAAWIARNGRAL
ncbi:HEXXH motif domain-containing protein [Nonomuraea sp. LPB2021202275-12-8]|uniref:HEXXH motif domain-containing protein n=1 Tax=Nonomuraea sp. LPB2021202275-12-8 TaxID=3120159 RepID=UPI00300D408C